MPLILHNVPDDERYVGEDGLTRPYAMIFGQNEGGPSSGTRSRRTVAETGSFGKSTRRSRSRTGTPARGVKEDPTLAAADKVFGDWMSKQNSSNNNNSSSNSGSSARKSTGVSQEDPAPKRTTQSTPVELTLRGYRSNSQQYAAICHYEELAGRILEDYPREPPTTQRRYKSDLRDPAYTRRRNLTPDERALVNRIDGGEHWVKVTFESAEAANAAMYASPQRILGHLVYAEPYRGVPLARDEACPDTGDLFADGFAPSAGGLSRSQSAPANVGDAVGPRRMTGGLPQSFSSRLLDLTAPDTRRSSDTLDTATLSPSRASTATLVDPFSASIPAAGAASTTAAEPAIDIPPEDSIFCRRIPTARRARLLPAEQALLPQQSVMQRFISAVPFINWFGGSMIGNEVPRTESGDFDWSRASLYWKFIWWLDATFGLFRGDINSIDKDE
ncbi:Nup53p-like protein [Beauveria brongniartii RCEF 3172]|uniref:Nup53p-like protein n=1 Tax=Beauveria brongniartii RCEF 3172 TaxID=1081107 RepID=A0A167L1C1_9HYPO|nr:Nup53p-like protein [Beauveria brongniartii RCEF 3172]